MNCQGLKKVIMAADVEKFFDDIKNGKAFEVCEFLDQNPGLKTPILGRKYKSAVYVALKHKRINIYKCLVERGHRLSNNERENGDSEC